MPLAYDRQPFKGCLRAPLRASQSNRNNIPYIAPPLLAIGPQSPLICGRGIFLRALLRRGLEKCWHINIYNLSI